MNEKIQVILFISVFILIYGLMNYCVISTLLKLFDVSRNFWVYSIIAIMTASYIGATYLESNYGNILTRTVYIMSAFWMGLLFILFCVILLYKLITLFITINPFIGGIVLVAIGLIIAVIGVINAETTHVNTVEIYSSKITSEIRIVQASDIHIGPINNKQFLVKIVDKINTLEPDYVFFTGDLVDGRYKYSKEDFSALKGVTSKKYFVTGNHETYAGIDYSLNLLSGNGLIILRNESVIDGAIQIIGIDDSDNREQVKLVLNDIKLNNSKYTILLYHRPVGFKDLDSRVDLMLSGHTHGGQIFPFSFFAYLENKYVSGLYLENNSRLFISSGAGTWGPPMRLGTRSEIVLIRILPQKK